MVDANFYDVSFDHSQFYKEPFFDGARFKGTLYLLRTKYENLNIRWSNISDLAYDDTAHYLLMRTSRSRLH